MADTLDRPVDGAGSAPAETAPSGAKERAPAEMAFQAAQSGPRVVPTTSPLLSSSPTPSEVGSAGHSRRKWLLLASGMVVLALGAYYVAPTVVKILNTVS